MFSSCDGGPVGRIHPWDGAGPGFSTSSAAIVREILRQTRAMPIAFNHTIVHAHDNAQASADFFSEILGLPAPRRSEPFLGVPVEHGATFDFAQVPEATKVHPQHYAFLVTEEDFDGIYGRLLERGIEH